MILYCPITKVSRLVFARLAALMLLPIVVTAYAKANDTPEISLIAAHIETRLDDDPESSYQRVIKYLIEGQHAKIRHQKYPLNRAIRAFIETKNSCLFPTSSKILNAVTGHPLSQLIQSDVIDHVSSHIFTAPGKPLISSLQALNNKSITARQLDITEYFMVPGVDINIIRTVDNQSALRMLLAGRADAMYGWVPDTYEIADEHGLVQPYYDPSLVVYETDIHFTCKDFPAARKLLPEINQQISKAKQDGTLQKMLGKHARIIE